MNGNQVNWDAGEEHSQTNPLVLIHRSLRGRYPITVALALIFGIIGGTAGYLSRHPEYRSTGVVRIQPSLPKVLFESEQSMAPRMFTSFVNSHAQLISNVDVVQSAMESDDWRAMPPEYRYMSLEDVTSGLSVRPDGRAQEIIRVSFSHTDPRVSQTIVESILNAYITKYGKEGSIKNPGIINALTDRERDVRLEKDRVNQQIRDLVSDYKTENFEPLIEEVTLEIRAIKSELGQVNSYLEIFTQEDDENTVSRDIPETPEEAALNDSRIASLILQRDTLIENRTEMMVAEGLREEHRDVRRVTQMIENLDKSIDERMLELTSEEEPVLYDEEGNPLPSAEQLRNRRERLEVRLAETERNAEDLFSASLRLEQLRKTQTRLDDSLTQVDNRLEMIETESMLDDMQEVTGKISIAARPTEAREPTSDPRIKMAAAGFVASGSLPVIAFLMLGYFSHRVNYSDDDVLSGANAGVIGMLPDLGNSLEDQELASASAFAVHQIRSQLQIKNTQSDTRVYGVTSPAPGDGKTSLIIAMGLSFAESGSRTLLVDLDFIGRGLSIHFGHPRSPSLAEEIGNEERVEALIQDTEFPGLSILPAGYGDDLRVSRLSPNSIRSLLSILRSRYDTILIDTGPILGSVEAAFVSPEADGVILVVGRGQFKPLIKKAIDQIHAVDGTIAATIFNRASAYEVRHSTSSMSVHFSRQFSRQQMGGGASSHSVGPLAGTLFNGKRAKSDAPRVQDAQS